MGWEMVCILPLLIFSSLLPFNFFLIYFSPSPFPLCIYLDQFQLCLQKASSWSLPINYIKHMSVLGRIDILIEGTSPEYGMLNA